MAEDKNLLQNMSLEIFDYMAKIVRNILLFGSFCMHSCNGHTQSLDPQNIIKTDIISIGKPKLVKTQGSNEYQDICCGLEDRKGNLWFGTTGEGVYRYDGKLFSQFTVQNGLSSNCICSMLEDKNGNIWIGTKEGLCCFDGNVIKRISMNNNSSFQSLYPHNNYSPTESSNSVFCIMQDSKQILWLGAADGVYCFNGKNFNAFLGDFNVVNENKLTLESVQCIHEDKRGNFWFGSGPMAFEGLSLYDGKTLTKIDQKDENWIRGMSEDENGNLLLTTRRKGVISFNGKIFSDFPIPRNMRKDLLNYILADQQGYIWYASDYVNDADVTVGGFWQFNGRTFHEFTKNDGINNTSVTFILEDKSKNIWIGTRNTGLYCYDGQSFTNFSE